MDDNRYTYGAEELYQFYQALHDAGFSLDQAFELTKAYVRQSTYEFLVSERQRRCSREVIHRRFDAIKKDWVMEEV